MSSKQNPSMVPRFGGSKGRKNLLVALRGQQSVAGSTALAKRLADAGKLCEFEVGKTIVRQGDSDNEMYFILSGSVRTIVNKREIAIRASGSHVGEMALLDPTARRSATIQAREKTLVLKVPESRITSIAKKYPDFWRRLAVELSTRLRERTKFIREPNPVPVAFIGSSSEASAEATYMSQALKRRKIGYKLWTDGVFQLSQTAVEDLVKISTECDFAILFLTPDDMTASRGRKRSSPRDNTVFELGLFMGAIGRDRTYLVVPRGRDLKLPTDLLGVTHAPSGPGNSIGKRLQKASKLAASPVAGQ